MKDKYAKKIFEAHELASKCQKISMWGATKTASVYVTAYDDFSTILEYLQNVIYYAKQIDGWEKYIVKFKNDIGFDKEDVLYSIHECEEQMDENLNKLREFVMERESDGWEQKGERKDESINFNQRRRKNDNTL